GAVDGGVAGAEGACGFPGCEGAGGFHDQRAGDRAGGGQGAGAHGGGAGVEVGEATGQKEGALALLDQRCRSAVGVLDFGADGQVGVVIAGDVPDVEGDGREQRDARVGGGGAFAEGDGGGDASRDG